MFSRHILFVGLLAAALIGPAIYFNDSWGEWDPSQSISLSEGSVATVPVRNASWLSPAGLAAPVSTVPVATGYAGNDFNPSRGTRFNSPPAAPFAGTMIFPGDANGPDYGAIPLEFMPITNLAEIFRFDVSQDWIKQRWQRVSGSPGTDGLSGLRVPLVTGVNTHDLFGSLTYFFDAKQIVQRITFRGWTGNPSALVDLATTTFDFNRRPTSSAGMYVAGSKSKPSGVLYLQNPTVIRAENPTQQVAILLEINNPRGPNKLSSEVDALVLDLNR